MASRPNTPDEQLQIDLFIASGRVRRITPEETLAYDEKSLKRGIFNARRYVDNRFASAQAKAGDRSREHYRQRKVSDPIFDSTIA